MVFGGSSLASLDSLGMHFGSPLEEWDSAVYSVFTVRSVHVLRDRLDYDTRIDISGASAGDRYD